MCIYITSAIIFSYLKFRFLIRDMLKEKKFIERDLESYFIKENKHVIQKKTPVF